jgi:prevent-host-death family protein
MERIALRELRNDVSRIVRRARAGERLIITVDGVPVAQIGPLEAPAGSSVERLLAEGRLLPRREPGAPAPATPIRLGDGRTTAEVLGELRSR